MGSHVGPVYNTGHNGYKVSDLQLTVSEVIATNAKIVIINDSVNDINASVPQATFASQYKTYMDTIKAGIPGVKFGCVSTFSDGEQFPDPGDHNGGPTDFSTIIAGVCYNEGGYYLDVRTAQQAYEQAHNTPAPGVVSGVLTVETPPTTGVHPNATGVALMGDAVLSQVKLGWLP